MRTLLGFVLYSYESDDFYAYHRVESGRSAFGYVSHPLKARLFSSSDEAGSLSASLGRSASPVPLYDHGDSVSVEI